MTARAGILALFAGFFGAMPSFAADAPSGAAAPAQGTPAASSGAPVTIGSPVEIDRVDGGTVYFKGGDGTGPSKVKTGLFELKSLGSITGPGDKPYFLFSGRGCANCQQDTSVYAVSPAGGKPMQFVYPGRLLDSRSRAVVLESRAFFGHCLAQKKGEVYVVFQKERIERKRRVRMMSSVYIAEPGPDEHLEERLLEKGLPRLVDTQRLVKAKRCREIPGRSRLMVSKPIDLRVHKAPGEDEDDDEDDEAGGDAPALGDAGADVSGTPPAAGSVLPAGAAPAVTPAKP